MVVPNHGDPERAVEEIVNFAAASRARILAEKTARTATFDGRIPDNLFEDVHLDGRLRGGRIRFLDLAINKPLTPSFRLFIKHPAIFTVLAKRLMARLPLYAVVRHPLAVLASWQTVNAPVNVGRWPMAEVYAPDLRECLDSITDPLSSQVRLLKWIFQQYRCLPDNHVLLYESIVQDPTSALRSLSGSMTPITYDVQNFDLRKRYPNVDFRLLAEALLAIDAEVRPFYPDFAESLDPYLKAV